MNILLSQNDVVGVGGWIADMGNQILGRFNETQERQFPCLFARKAFALGMVKFLPIPYLHLEKRYDFDCRLMYYL